MPRRPIPETAPEHACQVPDCGGVQLAHRMPDGSVRRWCETCQTRLEHLRALEGAMQRPAPAIPRRPMGATPRAPGTAKRYLHALPAVRDEAVTAIEWAARAGVPVERVRIFASSRRQRGEIGRIVPPNGRGIRYWRREATDA